MKITVVGLGYVGLSISILLSQTNQVYAVDISADKVNMINNKISPIKDKEIEQYLKYKKLNLVATTDYEKAFYGAEYIIIATPTDYDDEKKYFNTSAVESVIERVIAINRGSTIVIKSTIPVGYSESIIEKYGYKHILFCPEFLRETKALFDNLYPSRIIVGYSKENEELRPKAEAFACLLKECALKENVPVLFMGITEAEAVKLFANTYLALRVSFFNELDSYAEIKELDSGSIIEGIGLDPRIGMYYNNPSFGYGGYCLPKDTKQLLANYDDVPEALMGAIVVSNETRKLFIANQVLKRAIANKSEKGDCGNRLSESEMVIGFYRLTMKSGSDNFCQSSVQGVISYVLEKGAKVIIYEPLLNDGSSFSGGQIINDLDQFKLNSDCIVVNRMEPCLNDIREKVYTRDIYNID